MSKVKKVLSVFLCWAILLSQSASINAGQTNAANTQPSVDETLKLTSWQIEEIAEKSNFDKGKLDKKKSDIEKSVKDEKENAKDIQKKAGEKIKADENKLKSIPQSISDPKAIADRQNIKCDIVAVKKGAAQQIVASMEKRISYDVLDSKLALLRDWKTTAADIDKKIKSGTISQRPLGNSKIPIGNVLDIGARGTGDPFNGQEKDMQMGSDELKRLKASGEFPKEVIDPIIREYVNRLALNIGKNSDLAVPLNVIVVSETEKRNGHIALDKDGNALQVVNAFALPGGFLVVYTGLILQADSEAELAGALAHEIAHITARHGHRIMSRATKFGIMETIGKMATLFIPMGYLMYILLQYGFSGLDLLLNLNLLGISRDFELEADQLGMQYAWHSGYDPAGFISLFDRMAAEFGYASHTSYFQTHPAFVERVLVASKEEKALRSIDPNREYANNTSEFDGIKARTRKLVNATSVEEARDADKNKPTLYNKEQKEEEACKNILPPPTPLSSVRPVPNTPPVTSIPKPEATKQPAEPNENNKPPVLKRTP